MVRIIRHHVDLKGQGVKKIIFIAVVLAVFQNWPKITDAVGITQNASYSGNPVIMYSEQWCGYCRKARELFETKGIEYIEYDISNSEQAYREFKELGGKGVPLIVIDDKVLNGYSRQSILAALK